MSPTAVADDTGAGEKAASGAEPGDTEKDNSAGDTTDDVHVPAKKQRRVKLILGGQSEDGRAKRVTVPIRK